MAAPTLNYEEYYIGESPVGQMLNNWTAFPDGTIIDITSIEGLDSPPVREDIHDREGMHGAYVDAAHETLRTISIEGVIYATSAVNMNNQLNTLKAHFAPTGTDKPFYFRVEETFESGYRVAFGRPTGLRYRKDSAFGQRRVEFQVQILCGDPRIYSTTETVTGQVLTTGVNAVTVNIDGTRDTNMRVVITGPANTGLQVNASTATFILTYNTALNAGDKLHINMEERSVKLEEPGPVFTNVRPLASVVGTWYMPSAGGNGIDIVVAGATAATRVDVYRRSAWR